MPFAKSSLATQRRVSAGIIASKSPLFANSIESGKTRKQGKDRYEKE